MIASKLFQKYEKTLVFFLLTYIIDSESRTNKTSCAINNRLNDKKIVYSYKNFEHNFIETLAIIEENVNAHI